MAISTLVAGANGLAAFAGDLTYGPLTECAARSSWRRRIRAWRRSIADRTALEGRLSPRHSRRARSTSSASSPPTAQARSVDAGRRHRAAGGRGARRRSARSRPASPRRSAAPPTISTSAGTSRVVNFPGGGAARISNADIIGPQGARARISGGSGVTYYWPAGGLRIDSKIEMAGGGLAEGAGDLAPAPRRRADERRRRYRALQRRRRSGSRWRRSASAGAAAARPRSAPSRSSTGRSRTAG